MDHLHADPASAHELYLQWHTKNFFPPDAIVAVWPFAWSSVSRYFTVIALDRSCTCTCIVMLWLLPKLFSTSKSAMNTRPPALPIVP